MTQVVPGPAFGCWRCMIEDNAATPVGTNTTGRIPPETWTADERCFVEVLEAPSMLPTSLATACQNYTHTCLSSIPRGMDEGVCVFHCRWRCATSQGPWHNGSAADSRSEGHLFALPCLILPEPCVSLRRRRGARMGPAFHRGAGSPPRRITDNLAAEISGRCAGASGKMSKGL